MNFCITPKTNNSSRYTFQSFHVYLSCLFHVFFMSFSCLFHAGILFQASFIPKMLMWLDTNNLFFRNIFFSKQKHFHFLFRHSLPLPNKDTPGLSILYLHKQSIYLSMYDRERERGRKKEKKREI